MGGHVPRRRAATTTSSACSPTRARPSTSTASSPTPHAPGQHADGLGVSPRRASASRCGTRDDVVGDVPIVVTENGIATADDERRIAYTAEALAHLCDAIDDGIDVRGYLHWSLLDNFEWGRWEPTFGLVAVDRNTFERRPKPSLAWLGAVAQANANPNRPASLATGRTGRHDTAQPAQGPRNCRAG